MWPAYLCATSNYLLLNASSYSCAYHQYFVWISDPSHYSGPLFLADFGRHARRIRYYSQILHRKLSRTEAARYVYIIRTLAKALLKHKQYQTESSVRFSMLTSLSRFQDLLQFVHTMQCLDSSQRMRASSTARMLPCMSSLVSLKLRGPE